MLGKWPIRVKFLVGLGLLLLLVVILFSGSLYSAYTYRSLVIDLSGRANEIPLSGKFGQHVAELRIILSELRGLGELGRTYSSHVPLRAQMIRNQFHADLDEAEDLFSEYRNKLEKEFRAGSPISDNQREWNTVYKIEASLASLREESRRQDWTLDPEKIGQLDRELQELQTLAAALPSYLYDKMSNFRDDVRSQYRTLIIGTWITLGSAGLVFALFVKLFYQWVFQPLRLLVAGSRKVAAGQFGHRIHLDTCDEMAELAQAMNDMTARFQTVRDDLDRQVQERTKQVVRSEQLASVGFLAAGVAHEINNPLASIAMCAESLESRLRDFLSADNADHAVVANYLRMIQGEAFRCKEITERLLDFSRIAPGKRQNTDLGELVRGVIEMVSHLGKYQRKEIRLEVEGLVLAAVNPQEIKQVVLNLLANALESIDGNGLVRVSVTRRAGFVEIAVLDNGCGMSPEILEHIFEPFFTRKKDGQGTGLGLSISYRIVADHGGQLEAQSPGPGQGATFRVRLPSCASPQENRHQYLAA